MKVQCNQCGKIFEVPSSQTNRALKCVCKNIFVAQPLLEEVSSASPENLSTKASEGSLYDEATMLEATVTSVTSDEQIDDYISFLKKRRSETDPIKEAAPLTNITKPLEIEIELEKPIIPKSVEEEEALLPEPLPIPKSVKDASAPSARASRIETKPELTFQRSFLSNPWLVRGLSAAVIFGIPIILAMLVMKKPAPTETPVIDPYLQKLLEQPGASNQRKVNPSTPLPTTPSNIKVEEDTFKQSAKEVVAAEEVDELYKNYIDGNFQDVVRLANRLENLTSDQYAIYQEALIQRAENDRARLKQILSEIETKMSRGSHPAFTRSEAFARGQLASKASELQRPLETLKSLTQTQPYDALAFTYLGMVYARLDRMDMAHNSWEKALANEPGIAWLIRLRLSIYRRHKDFSSSERMAEALLQIPKFTALGYIELADLAMAQNRPDQAVEMYKKSLNVNRSSSTQLKMARVLRNLEPDKAASEFEKVMELDPTPAEAIEATMHAARIHCELGNYEKSIKSFTQLLNRKEDPKIYSEKAECMLRGNLLVSASEALEKALKYNSKDAYLWSRYGYTLFRRQKNQAALEAIRSSLKIKELDTSRLLEAKILLALKRKKEAQLSVSKALRINPDNREAGILQRELK